MLRRALAAFVPLTLLFLVPSMKSGATTQEKTTETVPVLFAADATTRGAPSPEGIEPGRTRGASSSGVELGSALREPLVDVELFDGKVVRFETERSSETDQGMTEWWGTALDNQAMTGVVIMRPGEGGSPAVVAAEFDDPKAGRRFLVDQGVMIERASTPSGRPEAATGGGESDPSADTDDVPASTPIEEWPTRPMTIESMGQLPMAVGRPAVEPTVEQFPVPDDAVGVSQPEIPSSPAVRAEAPADTNIIDILMIYTSQAASVGGGAASLEAAIQLRISQTNQALEYSGIDSWLRIVDLRQATYTEGASITEDKINLTDGINGLEQENDWRGDLKADLVAMVISEATYNPPPADSWTCGDSYIPDYATGQWNRAWSVTAYPCMQGLALPDGTVPAGYVLSHEIGHNLGGQHSEYDPHGDLPFGDNHGFVEENIFGTLMAYTSKESGGRPEGCPRLLRFSNPNINVSVGGQTYATGEIGSANNARGLNLLAPYISDYQCVGVPFYGFCQSDFRSDPPPDPEVNGSYTRSLVGDYDGDGQDDIFWYGAGTGSDSLWYGTDSGFAQSNVNVTGTYKPIVGDFDADGKDDIFWYGPGPPVGGTCPGVTGCDAMWYGSATGFASYTVSFNGNQIPIAGNFNGGAGTDDILFYGPPSTPPYDDWDRYWQGRTNRGFNTSEEVVSGCYHKQLAGDYNGDGRDDIFWYGEAGANDRLWYGADTSFSKSFIPAQIAGTYQYPRVGNFNGGSFDDILWYRTGDTPQYIDYGKSGTGFTQHSVTQGTSYVPLVGNFNGDQVYDGVRDDIYWFGPSTAADELWYGRDSGTGGLLDYPDPYFTNLFNNEELVGDYNGDGCDDLFWYGPGAATDDLYYGMDPLHDYPICSYS